MSFDFQHLRRQLATPGRTRYRLVVIGSYLLTLLVVSLAVLWELARLDDQLADIAHEHGATLFHQIELMRSWSRQQHPDDPQAAATRATDQLAALAELSEGIRFRVVTPSSADPWEKQVLAELAAQPRLTERTTMQGHGPDAMYRYLAPLAQDTAALSITLPASRLAPLRQERIASILALSLAAFLGIGGLAHLVARRTLRGWLKLQRINEYQQLLIDERTADLSLTNTLLTSEVEQRKLHQAYLEDSEARYRCVIESTQDGIALVQGAQIAFTNGRLAQMLGCTPASLAGQNWIEWVVPDERAEALDFQATRLRQDTCPSPQQPCWRGHLRHANPEIPPLTVDLQVLPVRCCEPEHSHTHDSQAQWVLNIRHVDAQLNAERDRQMAQAVLNSTAEAIMVTDRHNRIVLVNPAFTHITGYTAEEACGKTPGLLASGRHDKDFYLAMWHSLQEHGSWAGEIWNRRKDGSLYAEWLTVTALRSPSGSELPLAEEGGFVGLFTDITRRKEAEDQLRYRANHDQLTGLPNRSLFEDHLQMAFSQARRHQRHFALLYIDLDHFKAVNDTLGHAAGDELLSEAAQRMTLCVRESDTLSRLGGDEFAAILTEVDNLAEIEDVASRIVASLDRPFDLALGQGKISASIGIALYPQHGLTAEELKHNADLALYAVKQSTRNAYRLYMPESESESGSGPSQRPASGSADNK
jgi:diguanylate cyclase (GGDEF)-like protein/PAS domain S-box-containing protein